MTDKKIHPGIVIISVGQVFLPEGKGEGGEKIICSGMQWNVQKKKLCLKDHEYMYGRWNDGASAGTLKCRVSYLAGMLEIMWSFLLLILQQMNIIKK